MDKSVFIVGYGNIGKELAIRLRAFGVRVLATKHNPLLADGLITRKSHQLFQYLKENEDLLVDEKGSGDSLYDFASRADIIVLCCLLTPETAGMVNEKFVNSMKKGALVVNVARGGLLDYKSVRDGLETGHLGGLGLDVAWHEPYDPQDPILQHPKVILTPHVAGVTQLSYAKMAQVIADCAVELSHGRVRAFVMSMMILLVTLASFAGAADPDPLTDFASSTAENNFPYHYPKPQQQQSPDSSKFVVRDVFKNGDVSNGPGGVRAGLSTKIFPAME
ncbi:hypothetical protein SELMODRAFT_404020 [Selaginella moellendorffii]|uniref:D-isomer specific 2-hydroxyacid dehydrogenase NAD-binding domain-containing protein n=1 Tax=Selaginella moellendorffii TaxID=88036 RepID=D8QU10_SELML|nr:hypothetical protein SELMODRAFT_404020 [Selaginella moellendorffii]